MTSAFRARGSALFLVELNDAEGTLLEPPAPRGARELRLRFSPATSSTRTPLSVVSALTSRATTPGTPGLPSDTGHSKIEPGLSLALPLSRQDRRSPDMRRDPACPYLGSEGCIDDLAVNVLELDSAPPSPGTGLVESSFGSTADFAEALEDACRRACQKAASLPT
jgi:hypothetical protein